MMGGKEKRPDTTPASIENKRSKSTWRELAVEQFAHGLPHLRHSQQNQANMDPVKRMSPVVVTGIKKLIKG
jgi:hypothetical protein